MNVFKEVIIELDNACQKFPNFNSAHEGFAVLKEEIDELWDIVKLKQTTTDRDRKMRAEAIQCAAMAIRFVMDVCDKEYGERLDVEL